MPGASWRGQGISWDACVLIRPRACMRRSSPAYTLYPCIPHTCVLLGPKCSMSGEMCCFSASPCGNTAGNEGGGLGSAWMGHIVCMLLEGCIAPKATACVGGICVSFSSVLSLRDLEACTFLVRACWVCQSLHDMLPRRSASSNAPFRRESSLQVRRISAGSFSLATLSCPFCGEDGQRTSTNCKAGAICERAKSSGQLYTKYLCTAVVRLFFPALPTNVVCLTSCLRHRISDKCLVVCTWPHVDRCRPRRPASRPHTLTSMVG